MPAQERPGDAVMEPIITFEIRSEWFGVRAKDVREVARLRGVRAVPLAPEAIAGLAEVHGRLVTLIDLEQLLPAGVGPESLRPEEAPAVPAVEEFGVVLAAPYDHLGILSREGVDVTAASLEGEPPPGGAASWLQARLPIGKRILNLLSLPALVARVESRVRSGFQPAPKSASDEEA